MDAGSWGAIQGAKSAKIMKITTNTTPVAARGLWRAVRRNEMAAVGIFSYYKDHAHTEKEMSTHTAFGLTKIGRLAAGTVAGIFGDRSPQFLEL